jgi:hypothetical protein
MLFEAEGDHLSDPVHEFVKRPRLGVTSLQRGHRSHVDAFSISLDDDVEVGSHGVSLSRGGRFRLAMRAWFLRALFGYSQMEAQRGARQSRLMTGFVLSL